ncbi:hypothetical protein THERMOT_751 [Bathymodiolus thermophilus thioautotrophic gill symbiont]|uniref:hypothetical protein n=1 Tax=Bathymodiolus thermophilus thioautotrophic gill symbiont TaxID=2360 RepID=UPI00192B721D|nr:hypothetical protein [Bathymodiolus thermophilus thioautotrophic gill symbiont]CAB5497809.1 hypothetical protein THERMOT_751 [Bathymodiolus thermophilus thioautotrophic gill symbiont]
MLNKDNFPQCAFITVPLTRQLATTDLLKQANYLRMFRMFVRALSSKKTTNNFWLSSPNANNSSNAWRLSFSYGNDSSHQLPLIFLLASKVIGTIDLKITNFVYYFIHN